MRKGVDCPEQAQYFKVVKNTGAFAFADEDIICVFEEDAQIAEWRHVHFNGLFLFGSDAQSECLDTGTSGPHADGIRKSVLVIRTIATVGNYDYIYSIKLRPDASIEVCCIRMPVKLLQCRSIGRRCKQRLLVTWFLLSLISMVKRQRMFLSALVCKSACRDAVMRRLHSVWCV